MSRPLENITYDDVLEFCERGLKEDIDLDYKREWPGDLARVICAFANTQGGMVLIGVEEEEKSRRPKCPPEGVLGSESDLRQRALNVASDGVFPPVEPDVVACPVTSSPERHVVVIRVNPPRLLHATDRRKRVYVRSRDSNRGYDLATLSELSWLSSERDRSVILRSQLLSGAKSRSQSRAIPFEEPEGPEQWSAGPSLELAVLPQFPSHTRVIGLRELLDNVNAVGEIRSEWPIVNRRLPWRFGQWRTGPGVVSLRSKGISPLLQYAEFGQFAHAYFNFNLDPRPASSLQPNISDTREVIAAYAVLAYIDIGIRFTSALFRAMSHRLPLTLTCEITGLESRLLYYNVSRTNYARRTWLSSECPGDRIELLALEISGDSLVSELPSILEKASRELLWAFDVPFSQDQVQQWLATLVGAERWLRLFGQNFVGDK